MGVIVTTLATVEAEQGAIKLPRIGWHNLARAGTLVASSAAAGFPAAAAQNDNTFEFWKPVSLPATWRIDMGAATIINYFGIAAHNLGSAGATVRAQYSTDDAAWSNASDVAVPTNDGEVMLLFPQQNARYWRLLVDTAVPFVGVVYMGRVLTMPYSLYRGHTPITLARETIISPTVSEKGRFLGRSIIRSGLKGSVEFKNLSPSWYRANFDPFVLNARSYPFFLAWRPGQYPAEIAYCETTDDIVPSNSGPREYMSVRVSMVGAGYV